MVELVCPPLRLSLRKAFSLQCNSDSEETVEQNSAGDKAQPTDLTGCSTALLLSQCGPHRRPKYSVCFYGTEEIAIVMVRTSRVPIYRSIIHSNIIFGYTSFAFVPPLMWNVEHSRTDQEHWVLTVCDLVRVEALLNALDSEPVSIWYKYPAEGSPITSTNMAGQVEVQRQTVSGEAPVHGPSLEAAEQILAILNDVIPSRQSDKGDMSSLMQRRGCR